MIVKLREPSGSRDRRIKAGEDAERQMAHYLKRGFGDEPEILVFNDLRLCRKGEVAQIDHLVLHRWGLILIESKSITGRIQVNEHLEFTYRYGRKIKGMPSPFEQAKRQALLLHKVLVENASRLREPDRAQDGFRYCPVFVRIAIADHGVIDRSKANMPELMKADQVPDNVSGVIRQTRQRMIERKQIPWELTRAELMRVCCFLLERHTPDTTSKAAGSQIALDSVSPPEAAHAKGEARKPKLTRPSNLPIFLCTHCHSENVAVKYAYSYYLACADCDKNTPLKLDCATCNAVAKPRKRGKEFFAECSNCNEWRLVFVAK